MEKNSPTSSVGDEKESKDRGRHANQCLGACLNGVHIFRRQDKTGHAERLHHPGQQPASVKSSHSRWDYYATLEAEAGGLANAAGPFLENAEKACCTRHMAAIPLGQRAKLE
jgi:hypothetical protein